MYIVYTHVMLLYYKHYNCNVNALGLCSCDIIAFTFQAVYTHCHGMCWMPDYSLVVLMKVLYVGILEDRKELRMISMS